jgi:hypothetical protein
VESDLADATGMSVIHLNRTLQHLRSRNLIGRALQSRHPDRFGRLPLLGSGSDQHALTSRL